MLRVVETIIDIHRKLIGFTMEGKETEFGGFSVERVRKHIPLKTLVMNKFENNQVVVEASGVSEKGNFKINSLPMVVLMENKFVPVNNSITLKGRYTKDGDTVGFLVGFGNNTTDNYTYANVIRLSYWFKPTNFITRKSQTGKTFIYGKPGVCKLEDLPYKSLDNKPAKKLSEPEVGYYVETNRGASQGVVGAPVVNVVAGQGSNRAIRVNGGVGVVVPGAVGVVETGRVAGVGVSRDVGNVYSDESDPGTVEDLGLFKNDLDIFDLYSTLDKCGGLILKLPDETYKTGTLNVTKTDNAFQPLGVGEFAYPKLQFNETKLNATTVFRKPGVVSIPFGGGIQPINSFTYKNKFVFMNSENYIDRLGVAFPRQYEKAFIDKFSQAMCINAIDNTLMVKSVSSITNKRDLVYYELDTSKIDLIAKQNTEKYILETRKLYKLVKDYFVCRSIVKYLSPNTGLLRDLKKKLKVDYKDVEGKTVIPLYATMSKEFQDKLQEEGIDIYSGAYLKTVEVDKTGTAEAKRAKDNEDKAVVIDYAIKGYELKKWTYRRIVDYGSQGKNLPQTVIKVVQKFVNMADSVDNMKLAYEVYKRYMDKAQELKDTLWLHKCSMYLASNKLGIHQHDKGNWKQDTSRNTKATIYDCTLTGCESLIVSVENTTI